MILKQEQPLTKSVTTTEQKRVVVINEFKDKKTTPKEIIPNTKSSSDRTPEQEAKDTNTHGFNFTLALLIELIKKFGADKVKEKIDYMKFDYTKPIDNPVKLLRACLKYDYKSDKAKVMSTDELFEAQRAKIRASKEEAKKAEEEIEKHINVFFSYPEKEQKDMILYAYTCLTAFEKSVYKEEDIHIQNPSIKFKIVDMIKNSLNQKWEDN